MRRALPILALWAALASGLSVLTTRVNDWWVMTDELLYQRLAIAIARTHSPLPHVHGMSVDSFSQLYPLLISPAFLHGLVPDDLRQAHFLNAWLMSSACIPAFLLARRVTTRAWAAYLVAVLAVCMPWTLYASFLLTEVAAYPAFVWAMLVLQRALARPSARNDVLALAGLAFAFVARTQFAVLAIVLPLAIVVRCRSVRDLRQSIAAHRVLAWVYAAAAVVALALAAAGRLSSVLGVYGGTVSNGLVPDGTFSAFPQHLATFSLGFGILPVVVALAWLLANFAAASAGSEDTRAFASLATITVAAVMLEVTIYDLRFGVGYVHDRYLLYLAPLVLLAFMCALLDSARPRWSLLAPAALVCLGFALGGQPSFAWPDDFGRLNTESPVSALYALVEDAVHGVRATHVFLAVATVVLAALFALGAARLRRERLTVLLAGLLLVGLPVETGYLFHRFLTVDGWASRPVTNPGSDALDWVDETVGTRGEVTMVPYPVSTAFFVNQRVWRDYEFWNKSIVRNVQYSGRYVFRFTSDTFPKIFPRFDPATGLADVSPTRYVLHGNQESRFRISGPLVAQTDAKLIDAGKTWRTDWLTSGLYDDGWTQPGIAARVRVFATPGQRRALIRFLTFQIRPPEDVPTRRVDIVSDVEAWHGRASSTETLRKTMRVCVPPRGFAQVRVRTPDVSAIPGDLRDLPSSLAERRGGVFLAEIALSDDIGGPCAE